jgi:uncharacterized NAD(P)/FAD-binding protein YdhS
MGMTSSVAFVGAGPTTIYTLHALLDRATHPFALTIFEEQASAGRARDQSGKGMECAASR